MTARAAACEADIIDLCCDDKESQDSAVEGALLNHGKNEKAESLSKRRKVDPGVVINSKHENSTAYASARPQEDENADKETFLSNDKSEKSGRLSKRRKVDPRDAIDSKQENSVASSACPQEDGNRADAKVMPFASAEDSQSPRDAIIFLDTEGDDNGVVSDGIYELLAGLTDPNLITCAGQGRRSVLFHIQQRDKWSCGYRNLQMMLAALLPQLPMGHSYWEGKGSIPGVYPVPSLLKLQQALEQSWAAGFDPRGAEHFQYKIVGKSSWIGAVEVSHALSFWGIDSTVVEFKKCRESRSLLGPFCFAYFSKQLGREGCPFCSEQPMSSRVAAEELLQLATTKVHINRSCDCPSLPLYLQWKGHSVTICGVQRAANGDVSDLLVLDPLKAGENLRVSLRKGEVAPLRHSCINALLNRDCQVIICSTMSLSYYQKELRKEQVSAVTAAKDAVARTTRGSKAPPFHSAIFKTG